MFYLIVSPGSPLHSFRSYQDIYSIHFQLLCGMMGTVACHLDQLGSFGYTPKRSKIIPSCFYLEPVPKYHVNWFCVFTWALWLKLQIQYSLQYTAIDTVVYMFEVSENLMAVNVIFPKFLRISIPVVLQLLYLRLMLYFKNVVQTYV